eukprot:jgi/Astpho2/6042/Aster-03996
MEAGLVRGAAVMWADKAALKLQRRAHIMWENDGPKTVLIVKKPGSAKASAKLQEIARWCAKQGVQVLVERAVQRTEFPEIEPFDPADDAVDFCISLGGDGTVLHLTSLFVEDTPLPPVMSFSMGTLGFLTPFDVGEFVPCLQRVLRANEDPVFCTLRTRKRCEVYWEGQLQRVHHVLNECLVDRGASPNMVNLEAYIDGHHITTADGLIIATPSGSTAYSMSAGGPMVAPSVPGTLLTPIAPHSLSFRPLVVPESSEIEIYLPPHSRSHARASFDGRHTMRMLRDSSIRCTTSQCALPMINLGYLDRDWYEGITQKLKWNVAIRDTNTAEVEEFTRRQALARVKRERGTQRAPPHYSMSDPEGLHGSLSDPRELRQHDSSESSLSDPRSVRHPRLTTPNGGSSPAQQPPGFSAAEGKPAPSNGASTQAQQPVLAGAQSEDASMAAQHQPDGGLSESSLSEASSTGQATTSHQEALPSNAPGNDGQGGPDVLPSGTKVVSRPTAKVPPSTLPDSGPPKSKL